MDMTPFWILVVIVALWLLTGIIVANRKVKVPGEVPMRKTAVCIFITLSAVVILIRYGATVPNLLLALAMAAVGALSLIMRHGLSDTGVYMNGRQLKYEKMNYYHIELTDSFGTKIRFNSLAKDFSLTFPEEQVELVKAYMVKYDVPPFEAYQAQVQSDMKKRQQAKKKKK